MYCTVKVSDRVGKKAEEVVSELEYAYSQLEQCIQELVCKDLMEEIVLLLCIAWEIKYREESLRDVVRRIVQEYRERVRTDCLRAWLSNFDECVRRHTWSRDLIVSALLHYTIKALFRATGLAVDYDILEPELEVKPPAILVPLIEALKKTGQKPLLTYQPDSYMFCRYGEKCAHVFLEYKLHQSQDMSTVLLEDEYAVSKLILFLHGLDLLTPRVGVEKRGGEKLAIEVRDSALVCKRVILCIVHVVPETERVNLPHGALTRGDLLREPGVVKRLYTIHLSYVIPILDVALAVESLRMLRHDLLRIFSHRE